MTPELILDCGDILGESACWSVAAQQVRWIDGFAPAIHQWDPATRTHSVVPLPIVPVGMIVPTSDPDIVALTDCAGIGLFDLRTRIRTSIADPEQKRVLIGYNDAKVDGAGRLWVGTYDGTETEPRGCLWLLERDKAPRLADSGMAVVNGPAFSPNQEILYVSDSTAKRILAYDLHDGTLGARRLFAQFSADEGLPDGLTVDAEGCVWCAHWDGGRVTRFSSAGERLLAITLPAARVTSVAFGGASLDELFITTARFGLTQEQLALSPHAGGLFRVKMGIRGLPPSLLPLPFACK